MITLAQLRRAGLSRHAVKRRVQAGHLHRLYRGVYAVGHTNLSWEGRCMAAVLACGPGAALSHASDLERHFLRLLRSHELPLPEVNQRIGPYEVDFLWRADRLIVELDGYAYHADRTSFERDRRRDRELQARGYVVLRFADSEVDAAPEMLRERLA